MRKKWGDPVPQPQQPPHSHLPSEGKEEKEGANDKSSGHHYGECVACPAARAMGPNATRSPGPSAHSPGLASPLAEHRLDRVVHLGVLVVLGGHQELLNSPKKTHVSSDVRERLQRTHGPLDSRAPT